MSSIVDIICAVVDDLDVGLLAPSGLMDVVGSNRELAPTLASPLLRELGSPREGADELATAPWRDADAGAGLAATRSLVGPPEFRAAAAAAMTLCVEEWSAPSARGGVV
jgi:hypothetical protein